MKALGRICLIASAVAGNMSRESELALCLPPIENGWQGGPPARRSIPLGIFDQSNSLTSPSKRSQSDNSGKPFFLFSLTVSQAHLSHSTTARCSKPAISQPIAKPPAPANSSTDFILISALWLMVCILAI